MKTTMSEMKNVTDGINSQLAIDEGKYSECEDSHRNYLKWTTQKKN